MLSVPVLPILRVPPSIKRDIEALRLITKVEMTFINKVEVNGALNIRLPPLIVRLEEVEYTTLKVVMPET